MLFEVMYDESRVALGVMLYQIREKLFHTIYYESISLNYD